MNANKRAWVDDLILQHTREELKTTRDGLGLIPKSGYQLGVLFLLAGVCVVRCESSRVSCAFRILSTLQRCLVTLQHRDTCTAYTQNVNMNAIHTPTQQRFARTSCTRRTPVLLCMICCLRLSLRGHRSALLPLGCVEKSALCSALIAYEWVREWMIQESRGRR